MLQSESGWYVQLQICNGAQDYWEEVKLKTNGRYCVDEALKEARELLAEKIDASQFRIAKAVIAWKERNLIAP